MTTVAARPSSARVGSPPASAPVPVRRLGLDLSCGAGHLPAGQVVADGAMDGFPCDGSRVGTSSAGGGGQRAGDPDGGGAPAVPRRRSSRSDGRIGEGILEVRANGSPGADAAS